MFPCSALCEPCIQTLIDSCATRTAGAEGGIRTRTARRPLAPQGVVRLPRPSLLVTSVRALAGANSEAKASAQRPTESRLSVANRRHPDFIRQDRIRGDGPPPRSRPGTGSQSGRVAMASDAAARRRRKFAGSPTPKHTCRACRMSRPFHVANCTNLGPGKRRVA